SSVPAKAPVLNVARPEVDVSPSSRSDIPRRLTNPGMGPGAAPIFAEPSVLITPAPPAPVAPPVLAAPAPVAPPVLAAPAPVARPRVASPVPAPPAVERDAYRRQLPTVPPSDPHREARAVWWAIGAAFGVMGVFAAGWWSGRTFGSAESAPLCASV